MRRLALPAVVVCAALVLAGCTDLVRVEVTDDLVLDPPDRTSVVRAADGSRLASLHGEQDRDEVGLDEVPGVLRDAVLAVEDARFYDHGGVDGRALVRAVAANAREGRVVQGGSTISQQLAKVAVTGDDRTVDRKVAEAAAALRLEARYGKDGVLERYLNTVYLGGGAYGVQAASRHYFGVDVGALDLPRAALLAGLVRAPVRDDPFKDPDRAQRRRATVLQRMVAEDVVDADEAAVAAAQPLGLAPTAVDAVAPWFTDLVLAELQHDPAFAVLGGTAVQRADRLFRGGLEVETTLDPAWQEAAEDALAATLNSPDDPYGALVAIDPATGEVRAVVGGRAYGDAGDPVSRFNLASDARRQPGSAFKAVVLAAALDAGHRLEDTFPGGAGAVLDVGGGAPPWTVRNYDDRDPGPVTLAAATAQSVNTVYARLTSDVGPEAVADLARDLGVGRDLPAVAALGLGAGEVSPLELASVYATLAADGVHRAPSTVRVIRDADGTVLYERGEVEGERVLDGGVAALVTEALQGVVAPGGTGEAAAIARPLAGKTGTSQRGADAWFAGYTPDLAAAVWMGFPEGAVPMVPPRTRVPVEGGGWPSQAFARFALAALAELPATPFAEPEGERVTVAVDAGRGCLPNPYTPRSAVEERAYLAGTEPTAVCTEPTGPDATTAPDVVGLPAEAARRVLADAGYGVAELTEPSATLPPGTVLRQASSASGAVLLVLAAGHRADVVVPDVLGLPAASASAVLEETGLRVERVDACPDGTATCEGARVRPGRVFQQQPDAGRAVGRGTLVRVEAFPS